MGPLAGLLCRKRLIIGGRLEKQIIHVGRWKRAGNLLIPHIMRLLHHCITDNFREMEGRDQREREH